MHKEFYLQDSRGLTGDNVMFHKAAGGYGTNLNELEVLSLDDAQKSHNCRSSDVPLLKSLVDEKSIRAVDSQVLPEPGVTDPNNEYVVQVNGKWNGNDILFIGTGEKSYNYDRAMVLDKHSVDLAFSGDSDYTVYAKQDIDKVARRTFQAGNINIRKMVTGAGIKRIRPKRVRQTTGKTRSNCPACGRIVWDHNPYEPVYCGNYLCSPD